MGLYAPAYSENGASIEYAVLELLDLVAQRAGPPGVDDVMGSVFMADGGDGLGVRVRPSSTIKIRAKVGMIPHTEQQELDQTGNDPDSMLFLTLYEEDLLEAGLLVAGKVKLKAGDRLLRLENSDGIQASDGTIRVDYAHDGRVGLRCLEVRAGLTGERTWLMIFESQRASTMGA